MDKMFTNFFGFTEDPFIREPNADFYFTSKQYQNALQTLSLIFQTEEKFAMLVGRSGTGKSATLHKFIQDMSSDTLFINTPFPNLKTEELLRFILNTIGYEPGEETSKHTLAAQFRKFLEEKSEKRVVLVIDEAQKTPDETIEDLFLFSGQWPGLSCLLAGRPELIEKLDAKNLQQLKQKITLIAKLDNLEQEEINEYLCQRTEKAGRKSALTGRGTTKLIWKCTQGNPRLINTLMKRAIVVAYMDASNIVKSKHINSAARSLNSSAVLAQDDINSAANIQTSAYLSKSGRTLIFAGLAAVLAFFFAFKGYGLYSDKTKRIDKQFAEATVSALPTLPAYQETLPSESASQLQPQTDTVIKAQTTDSEAPEPPALTKDTTAEPIAPISPAPPAIAKGYFGVGNTATVVTNALNVRSLPKLDAEKIDSLHEGQRVIIQEETLYWVRITLPNGREGWVNKQYLIKPEAAQTVPPLD